MHNKFKLYWSQLVKRKVRREEENRLFDEFLKDDIACDNLTWAEEELGIWKGWTYSPDKKRYYFDDIGNESLMGLWEDPFLGQAYEGI